MGIILFQPSPLNHQPHSNSHNSCVPFQQVDQLQKMKAKIDKDKTVIMHEIQVIAAKIVIYARF